MMAEEEGSGDAPKPKLPDPFVPMGGNVELERLQAQAPHSRDVRALVLSDWKDDNLPSRVKPNFISTRIPHLAQTSDAVNRQLSCFSSRYMNLLAVFQI